MTVRIRPVTPADRSFLEEMIVHAAFRPGSAPDLAEALRAPHVVPWIEAWGRAGDVGVIAEHEQPLGAAWCRCFRGDEIGLGGFVDAETPVLSIAVRDGHRGSGIGTVLLEALVAAARADGRRAISLSVGRTNPALRLYERSGFERIGEAPLRLLRHL